jgi:hypothetical protein
LRTAKCNLQPAICNLQFALCLAALILASAVAWGVFEAMPHIEDEHAYLFQARVFASGRIAADTPRPEPNAFFIPFVLDRDGRRFAKYTPGYPLALALGVLVGCPWLVNALAAAGCAGGVYLLGRDLFDRDTGLLAAGLGVVSPMFVILSGTLLSHTATLAAITLFAWAYLRARRPDEPRRIGFALLAGLLLGWAILARPWTALAIAVPFALLALSDLVRGRAALPYGAMLLSCALVAALLPLYNWALTGSPTTNTYTLWWPYDAVGFGPGFGRSGHTLAQGLATAKLDLAELGLVLLGWPVIAGLPLAALPMLYGLLGAPRSWREWGLAAPVVTLVAAYLAYWAYGRGLYGPRYYSEGLAFLWLLAARGLVKLGALRWGRRGIKLALPVLLVWSIVFVTNPKFNEGRGRYDVTRRDTRIIAAANLHHALVLVRGDEWTDYANLSWLNSPGLDGNVVFAKDRGSASNAAVMGAYPDRAVYWYDRDAVPPLIPYEQD